MADIDSQITLIDQNEYGEVVRNAIADADEAISADSGVNISNEIHTIRNARYGYEIRNAIIEALEKLNTGGSGPSYQGPPIGQMTMVFNGAPAGPVGKLVEVEDE